MIHIVYYRLIFAPKFENNTIMKKLLFMTVIMTSIVMASCNVTRIITNESQYLQRGDTSVVIQTKTIETYDAKKNLAY